VFLVAMVAVVMMASIAHIEKKAWADSEVKQATLLITLLSDELKMPMVAVSKPEVDSLIRMFMRQIPDALVYLRWSNGDTEKFGKGEIPAAIESLSDVSVAISAVEGHAKWYATEVRYNTTVLGSVALFVPGKSWRDNDLQIKMDLTITAAIIALLASLMVYFLSGRMVKQLRLLAMASKRVASGDFSVQIPIYSSNEFGKSFHQFNKMVAKLERREKVFDLYGRYQRPSLVANEYDRNSRLDSQDEREVSVLAIEMIDFDAFIQHCDHQQVMADLNAIFTLFQQIIQELGGHVDQVLGDRMIAVFNHPFDLKSHENQAAKAGLALLEANKRYNEEHQGKAMQFAIGLAVGEVIVGHLGLGRRKEFTVIGAPLALALQLARVGDHAYLSAQYGTMLLLGHGFKQKDLGQQRLSDGNELRCIQILPGEDYVHREIDAVIGKAFKRAEPDEINVDEGW